MLLSSVSELILQVTMTRLDCFSSCLNHTQLPCSSISPLGLWCQRWPLLFPSFHVLPVCFRWNGWNPFFFRAWIPAQTCGKRVWTDKTATRHHLLCQHSCTLSFILQFNLQLLYVFSSEQQSHAEPHGLICPQHERGSDSFLVLF